MESRKQPSGNLGIPIGVKIGETVFSYLIYIPSYDQNPWALFDCNM